DSCHGNRCSKGPYCQHYFLHKFRHTFATEHLRHGVDIRTLQAWMGHRDIKSTIVYLKGVQSKDVLEKINAGALAGYVGVSHSCFFEQNNDISRTHIIFAATVKSI